MMDRKKTDLIASLTPGYREPVDMRPNLKGMERMLFVSEEEAREIMQENGWKLVWGNHTKDGYLAMIKKD